jgi:hypothetical protein
MDGSGTRVRALYQRPELLCQDWYRKRLEGVLLLPGLSCASQEESLSLTACLPSALTHRLVSRGRRRGQRSDGRLHKPTKRVHTYDQIALPLFNCIVVERGGTKFHLQLREIFCI